MRRLVPILLLIGLALAQALTLSAQGTIAPSPFQTVFNNSGTIVTNSCVWTYSASTSTLATTYTDSALATPNTNPIRSDSAGRFTAFLAPGSSYKFVYETSCVPPGHGTTLRTADNIAATPSSSVGVDVLGTAGEAISANQCVYLSDGSGSKTSGQWFKCDSTNTYSSTSLTVGIATAAISSANTGTIRIAGVVTGFSSLSVGASYFASTAGTITTTAPVNRRFLGIADTTASIVLTSNPPPVAYLPQDFSVCDLRLTLTSGTPVSTADVTAATSVYVTPIQGGRCGFYDGSATWTVLTPSEVTVSVPATTSTMYDLWCRNNAGTMACDTTAWTNDTTRATALTTQTSVYVKTGDTTRRYMGSFRTTTVSGQTEDSVTKRYVWSYYHRVPRPLLKRESTASWAYTTATVRQANGAAANQVEVIVGVAEARLALALHVSVGTTTAPNLVATIGEDSTTTASSNAIGGQSAGLASLFQVIPASLTIYPAIGRHFYAWLEYSTASGTTTWYSGASSFGVANMGSGLSGWIEG